MAVTTSRNVTMGFLDNQGNSFKITLSKAKDLTDASGKALVNTAMDTMLTSQPYTKVLAAKQTAYQTQTTKTDIELTNNQG